MWHVGFSVASVFLSILSFLVAVWSARTAIRALALPAEKTRSFESRLASCSDSIEGVQAEVAALANRMKMQRVRAATEHVKGSSGEPDPYRDPDGWRKSMNAKLARSKIGAN